MEIDLGADIISNDGEKLGTVDSLVMDPTSHEIRSIVVRKGFFFPTDRILPADLVTGIEDGVVRMNISEADANNLEEYMDANYLMPPAGFYGAPGYMWPATSTMIYNAGALVDEQIHQRYPDAIVLSEGTLVVDNTGDELGRVTELASDESGRVVGLRVEQGFFRHHERYIPVHFIAKADDSIISLSVDKSHVEDATAPR